MTKSRMVVDGSYFNAGKMDLLIFIAAGIPINLVLDNGKANSGLDLKIFTI